MIKLYSLFCSDMPDRSTVQGLPWCRISRLTISLGMAMVTMWLAGCTPPYVQEREQAVSVVNATLSKIQNQKASISNGLSQLPIDRVKEFKKVFDQAEDVSRSSKWDCVKYVQSSGESQGQLVDEIGCEDSGGVNLIAPGFSAWMGGVIAVHDAEQFRISGQRDKAMDKAYEGWYATDLTDKGNSDIQYMYDTIVNDVFKISSSYAFKRAIKQGLSMDHKAALVEVWKISLGPAAIANQQQLARNPAAWYERAALYIKRSTHYATDAKSWESAESGGSAYEGDISKDKKFAAENMEKALQLLDKSFSLGFRNWRSLDKDPRFKRLRKLPEFRRLVAHYRDGH